MSNENNTSIISWDNSVPIFGRGVVGKQLAWVFGVPFALIFGGVAISSMVYAVKHGYPIFSRLDGMQYALFMVGITALLTYGVVYAMNRNRYLVHYEVSEEGIFERYQDDQLKKNQKLNMIGTLALFLGKPGVAGSAMLAQSRQKNYIKWTDVDSFKVDPKKYTIEYRVGLVHGAVFCTADNYQKVLAYFNRHVVPTLK